MDGDAGQQGGQAAEPPTLNGGCFCGKACFQAAGPVVMVYNCHCTICQRLHGAPFARFVYFAPGAITPKAGSEEFVGSFRTSETVVRYHCRVCASPLYGEINPKGFECTCCPLTALERGPDGRVLGLEGLKPMGHNYYVHRVADADDDLPKNDALPPGFESLDCGKMYPHC
ncbi:unnamed protein product [Ostreobium quekettii]|uniref:CENP-V/GFA domain-containing protein n=1 Tax=Ostreobium quekettii TaxID=121088 RepID=A0A8S1JDA4_9CHLO|nr:unnamed protein product [Ostreobium quekettii]